MVRKLVKPWSRYAVHRAGMEKVEMHIKIVLGNVLKKSKLVEKEMKGHIYIYIYICIYSEDGTRMNVNGARWCPMVRFSISGAVPDRQISRQLYCGS